MSVNSVNSTNPGTEAKLDTKKTKAQFVHFGKSESTGDEYVSSAPKKKKNKWLAWLGLAVVAVAAAIGFKKLGTTKKALEKSLVDAKAEIEKLTRRNTELEREIEKVISDHEEILKKWRKGEEEIMDLEEDIETWKQKFKKASLALDQKENECTDLKLAINSLKNFPNN